MMYDVFTVKYFCDKKDKRNFRKYVFGLGQNATLPIVCERQAFCPYDNLYVSNRATFGHFVKSSLTSFNSQYTKIYRGVSCENASKQMDTCHCLQYLNW